MSDNDIRNLFEQAIEVIALAPKHHLSLPHDLYPSEQIMQMLYGLYKQSTTSSSPNNSIRSQSSSSPKKKEAWKAYHHLPKTECQILYLALIYPIIYRWVSLPIRIINRHLASLTKYEKTSIEPMLSQAKDLLLGIEKNSEIMSHVVHLNTPDSIAEEVEDDNSSEFSFEDLSNNIEEATSRHRSASSVSGYSYISEHYYETMGGETGVEFVASPPLSAEKSQHRRLSICSMKSVELHPTVPYTPSVGPSNRHRYPSTSDIVPLTLTSPVKSTPTRSRSNSSLTSHSPHKNSQKSSTRSSSKSRTRTVTGPPPPQGLTDETSALIQSTSHRLGQGMVLVRRSLQRLQKLEEKVDGALHQRLQQVPSHDTSEPNPTSHQSPKPHFIDDSSISGWLNKVCHTLL